MFKLTIIVALAIASMSFVEVGEIFPTEQKEKNGNQPKGKDAKSEQGSKGDHKERVNTFPSGNDQHGDKKVKQESKNQSGPLGHSKKEGSGTDLTKQKQKENSNRPFIKEKQEQNKPFGKQKESHNKPFIKQKQEHNKPFGKKEKGHGSNSDKPHKKGKPSIVKQGNKHKGNSGKKKYDKGHPNFGYVYVNKHGYYSHSNYGQWRSHQAKHKHKHYHPVYEVQAIEGFNLIIVRNRFLFTETDYKINLIRVRLAERRKANLITVVEYNQTLSRVVVLEQRRAALEINIEL